MREKCAADPISDRTKRAYARFQGGDPVRSRGQPEGLRHREVSGSGASPIRFRTAGMNGGRRENAEGPLAA